MLEHFLELLACRRTVRYHLSHFTCEELPNIQFPGRGCERRRGYGGRQGHGRFLDVLEWRIHVIIFGKFRTGSLTPSLFGITCLANLSSQIKQSTSCWSLLREGRFGLKLDITVDGGTDSG
jgi:hypothetical protein